MSRGGTTFRDNIGALPTVLLTRGSFIESLSEMLDVALMWRWHASRALGPVLEPKNAGRFELDEPHTDYETQDLLHAPVQEQERRIEQILLNRKIRDAAFRSQVCAAYDNQCAITGLRILNGSGKSEAQAAHIWAVSDGGRTSCKMGLRFQARYIGSLIGT